MKTNLELLIIVARQSHALWVCSSDWKNAYTGGLKSKAVSPRGTAQFRTRTEDVGDRRPEVQILAHPSPPSLGSSHQYIKLYTVRIALQIIIQHVRHVVKRHVLVAVHHLLGRILISAAGIGDGTVPIICPARTVSVPTA